MDFSPIAHAAEDNDTKKVNFAISFLLINTIIDFDYKIFPVLIGLSNHGKYLGIEEKECTSQEDSH